VEVYLKEQDMTGQREREMASRQQLAEDGIAKERRWYTEK